MKFYKCKKCGNVIRKLVDKCDGLSCCGVNEVVELTPNTVDAAKEKHVPVVSVSGNSVKVAVGSAAHPMSDAHHIAFIILETSTGHHVKDLVQGSSVESKAEAEFLVAPGEKPLAVYEYCNLHGLWKADV